MTSREIIPLRLQELYSTAATTGLKICDTDSNACEYPAHLVNWPSGTICGVTACRQGLWNAEPTERASKTTRISSVDNLPIQPAITITKLAAEIRRSEIIMILFRLYRSIKTPINGPKTPCGRNPIIIAAVSTMAEPVWSVRYHTIAN